MATEDAEVIHNHWTHLQRRWEATADGWNDSVRTRFEREYWGEYERLLAPFIERVRNLEEALAKARHHVR